MTDPQIAARVAAQALFQTGSRVNWRQISKKKKLTLGFLGGSVTQGYIGGTVLERAFPQIFAEMLRARGQDVQTYVLAEAGMDTVTGNLLCESQLMQYHPDLVFIEFAINETTLRHSVLSFESLLCKLIERPEPPVVCLLLMRSANGYGCDSYMEPIAEHYGLPCVSMRRGLEPALDDGSMTWDEFADSESHPHLQGHELLAQCLMHLYEQGAASVPQPIPPLPEPWLGIPFRDLVGLLPGQETPLIITKSETVPCAVPYFPAAWKLTEETGAWEMAVCAKTLVLFYETDNDPKLGSCRILLDGVPLRHPMLDQGLLRTESIYGWGNSRSIILLMDEQPTPHILRVEPVSESVYLLCAGYSR